MKEGEDKIEKHILENGLKETFRGGFEQIINEISSFLNDKSFQEKIILKIRCDQSKEITMDDIGLLNDTIQKEMLNKASIVMHIEEHDITENYDYELSLYYLKEN
ncbi:hypothetical protein [Faecalibacter macacae]|uniref:Uncharacterized protein n=1 Tax=Faecalibacter macacae TaxID=1859289 RepID=A0A3L9M1W7_9FLAO|nr:hypothetical protein [Faecalibacter macacae]RLZ07140.1 hypothetical protein EAH69_11875 [Faecalibacter macacae]